MAGIADLKAKLAELEDEIKSKTEKAYSDLGRAVAAAYESKSNSIPVTDEIREILDELTSGASPRARGKRITVKSVSARLVDVFSVESSKAQAALEEFEKAKLKKFLPRITSALDECVAQNKINSTSALAALRAVYSDMTGSPATASPSTTSTSEIE